MNALTPLLHKDPTQLVWSPTMLIELALKTAPPDAIRQEYGYTQEEWDALPHIPAFLKDLSDACELVEQEGMSFRLKARLLAEDFLPQVYRMVNDAEKIPATVRADLIKATMRWAGYENKPVEGQGAVQANSFAIQINLGNDL